MTTIQLATLLARIVKNSVPATDAKGAPIECSRLNTFAVIYDQAAMQSQNISKTADYKQKDYFFSRKWSLAGKNSNSLEWDFPALFIWENTQTFDNPFDQQTSVTQNYTFAISDKMPLGDKDCKNCAYCEKRDVEQVTADLRSLAKKLLATLAQYSYYTLILAGLEIGEGWYSESEIQAMVVAGDIDSALEGGSFAAMASGSEGGAIQFDVVTAAYTQDTATLFMNIQLQYDQCLQPFDLQVAAVLKPIKNVGCC